MSAKSADYNPLPTAEETGYREECHCGEHASIKAQGRRRDKLPYLLVIVLQSIALLLASAALLRKDGTTTQDVHTSGPNWPSRMWSPAEKALEYEVRVFTGGFNNADKTIYQEVSDESDRAWERLYNLTLMRIPKSEAILLPNRTYPIKELPGYYLTELDVFHQLHCLNKIRQALNKDRYITLQNAEFHLGEDHISHCIDSIRQSLMCNADISTIPWQWHNESKKARPRLNYPHKCVNFDKLWEWVAERRIDDYIDPLVHVDDGLPEPEIVY